MKRRAVVGIASCVAAIAAIACACACAKAPEARSNGNPESNVEPSADAGVASALSDVSDASTDADARFPGLPMPQKFPHVVWDAAGAPRDAAAR